MLIEDLYILPEFRGTPAASVMMAEVEKYLRSENIISYYGRVFCGSTEFKKRIKTFKKWGMEVHNVNQYYSVVIGKLI